MKTVDDIYTGIAEHTTKQINEDWNECTVSVEFLVDAAEFEVTYTNNKDEICDLDGGYHLFKLFKELHTVTTEESENKWNRARFTLVPTGKFNIDFEWDQELADEIERLSNDD